MIPLFQMNKSSCIKIGWTTWIPKSRQDYHKIEKIFKHKSQRLNTLEKVLDKNTPLPESILFYLNSWTDCNYNLNTFCPFSGYRSNCTFCYRWLWRRRRDRSFANKRWGGLEKMVRQVSRRTQKTCRKGCWSIACYCRKCCWCNFKFAWEGHWIRFWTYMGPNCFCCGTCWLVVDAKS